MTTLRHILARAIATANGARPDVWESEYLPHADACIQALRDAFPGFTDAQIIAGLVTPATGDSAP